VITGCYQRLANCCITRETLLKILLGLRHNVRERNQGKRRRSLETRAQHRGGIDVRRAMIAGISLSISNPKSIASELKVSNPALHSTY
jgi:hypothetical protein